MQFAKLKCVLCWAFKAVHQFVRSCIKYTWLLLWPNVPSDINTVAWTFSNSSLMLTQRQVSLRVTRVQLCLTLINSLNNQIISSPVGVCLFAQAANLMVVCVIVIGQKRLLQALVHRTTFLWNRLFPRWTETILFPLAFISEIIQVVMAGGQQPARRQAAQSRRRRAIPTRGRWGAYLWYIEI